MLPSWRGVCGIPPSSVALSVALLMGSLGLVASGITPFIAFPKTDSNEISASITFPDGSPAEDTYAAAAAIEQTILRLDEEYRERGLPLINTTRLAVGQVRDPSQLGPEARSTGSHVARVDVELVEAADREMSSQEIIQLWRDASDPVPGRGIGDLPGSSHRSREERRSSFDCWPTSAYMDQLEEAVEQCKAQLATYAGVVDIRDDSRQGKWEFQSSPEGKGGGAGDFAGATLADDSRRLLR